MLSFPSEVVVATTNGSAAFGGLLLLLIGLCLYFLPTIVGSARHVRSPGTVFVINLFLGWTFIGWVVALALAFGEARTTHVAISVVQHPGHWSEGPETRRTP